MKCQRCGDDFEMKMCPECLNEKFSLDNWSQIALLVLDFKEDVKKSLVDIIHSRLLKLNDDIKKEINQ